MAKLFFETIIHDIYPKLLKCCCGHNLTSYKLFPTKKFFMKVKFLLTLFAYPGSWILRKNGLTLFPDNHSLYLPEAFKMVLQTKFNFFQVVLREIFFLKIDIF